MSGSEAKSPYTRLRLRSVVAVPIRSEGKTTGAIYLDHRFQAGWFSNDDVPILCGFADQVAIALRNARLHKELADRAEQLLRRTQELELEKEKVEELAQGQAAVIANLNAEVRSHRRQLGLRHEFGQIVGSSVAMRSVLEVLDRVIDSSLNVLVHGESGTGKELIARALHFNGSRKEARFVALNCAALPEQLLESELFGYTKGAFTGADRTHQGLLVAADGGTLFLDEVAEMPLSMQAKLLRAIQEGQVRPLGGHDVVDVDVRIVAATNRPLGDEVAAGRFRQDLFYRLAVVEVTVPPLRDRLDDLPELVHAICRQFATQDGVEIQLTATAFEALSNHRWPGNVRELQNVLRRASVMSAGRPVTPEHFQLGQPRIADDSTADPDKEEADRLRAAAVSARWNLSEVSRSLGIPRNTLYRKLKRYGIERPQASG